MSIDTTDDQRELNRIRDTLIEAKRQPDYLQGGMYYGADALIVDVDFLLSQVVKLQGELHRARNPVRVVLPKRTTLLYRASEFMNWLRR